MNFLLVDKDTWDCAEILSKDEIKEELNMNDTQFYNFLERGSLFRDQYYLVEDEYSMPKKKNQKSFMRGLTSPIAISGIFPIKVRLLQKQEHKK